MQTPDQIRLILNFFSKSKRFNIRLLYSRDLKLGQNDVARAIISKLIKIYLLNLKLDLQTCFSLSINYFLNYFLKTYQFYTLLLHFGLNKKL